MERDWISDLRTYRAGRSGRDHPVGWVGCRSFCWCTRRFAGRRTRCGRCLCIPRSWRQACRPWGERGRFLHRLPRGQHRPHVQGWAYSPIATHPYCTTVHHSSETAPRYHRFWWSNSPNRVIRVDREVKKVSSSINPNHFVISSRFWFNTLMSEKTRSIPVSLLRRDLTSVTIIPSSRIRFCRPSMASGSGEASSLPVTMTNSLAPVWASHRWKNGIDASNRSNVVAAPNMIWDACTGSENSGTSRWTGGRRCSSFSSHASGDDISCRSGNRFPSSLVTEARSRPAIGRTMRSRRAYFNGNVRSGESANSRSQSRWSGQALGKGREGRCSATFPSDPWPCNLFLGFLAAVLPLKCSRTLSRRWKRTVAKMMKIRAAPAIRDRGIIPTGAACIP